MTESTAAVPSFSAKPDHSLRGTGQLLRLALRRDRIILPVWVLLLGLIPASTVGTYEKLYPTAAERLPLTAGIGANPSTNLIYGPAFDLATPGGYTAWKYGTFLPLFLALACIFTIIRHTRQEEETGRAELLSSGVVGRFAALTSAVVLTAAASLIVGLLITISLIGMGLPAGGSLAFGLSSTLVGWVFIGMAVISAQVVEYSRTANGISGTILGIAFLLRAVGDAARDVSWLSWLSPIGWATQVHAFTGEKYWVLLLLLLFALALTGIGYGLLPRRDSGLSMFPTKAGPAGAARGFRSPLALAWRLHRGALLGWLTGFVISGAVFGSLASGIGDVLGNSGSAEQIIQRMGGQTGLVNAFLAAIAGIFGMVASLYTVQTVLRMRTEEAESRAEPLLACGVSRFRWAASHLIFTFGGSALLLIATGISAGLAHSGRVGAMGTNVSAMVRATLAQLPAVWLVAGVALLLFGLAPVITNTAWAVAVLFLLISIVGPVANLPQWIMDISPFTHIPRVPGAGFTVVPLLWLLIVAIIAAVVGLFSYRHRDVG